MTTELTKAAQQALEALKHGVAQLNGIGIPLEADPLHMAIAALERALAQRHAAQTEREAFLLWWAGTGMTLFQDTAFAAWQARASLPAPQQETPASGNILTDAFNEMQALKQQATPEPIPMVLHCPKCGMQHIDEADHPHYGGKTTSEGFTPRWDNPPHRSHLCHGCGTIWRPADVPTTGVKAITTKGKADTWEPGQATPTQQAAGEPVGEVDQIDIDEDGQAHAWVVLHNNVTIGTKLYIHPAPGVPGGWKLRVTDLDGRKCLVIESPEGQAAALSTASRIAGNVLDALAAAQAKGADPQTENQQP